MTEEYKGYRIIGDQTFGMYSIHNNSRGAIHRALKGAYTSVFNARRAIDAIINSKETEDAKRKGSSRV